MLEKYQGTEADGCDVRHGGPASNFGTVSGALYRSGPSKTWLKSKNPASEAVRREGEEEWRYSRPRSSEA